MSMGSRRLVHRAVWRMLKHDWQAARRRLITGFVLRVIGKWVLLSVLVTSVAGVGLLLFLLFSPVNFYFEFHLWDSVLAFSLWGKDRLGSFICHEALGLALLWAIFATWARYFDLVVQQNERFGFRTAL